MSSSLNECYTKRVSQIENLGQDQVYMYLQTIHIF